jgi:ligand-binding SRPBCC domain-containing protein
MDRVEYQLPLGPLGDLLNAVAVKGQLQRMFAYRQRQMEELMPLFAQRMAARKA